MLDRGEAKIYTRTGLVPWNSKVGKIGYSGDQHYMFDPYVLKVQHHYTTGPYGFRTTKAYGGFRASDRSEYRCRSVKLDEIASFGAENIGFSDGGDYAVPSDPFLTTDGKVMCTVEAGRAADAKNNPPQATYTVFDPESAW